MKLEIQVMGWDRQKNVAVLSRLMGSQPSHLDNWIFNGNTYINKRLKNLHRFSSTQTRSHTIRTMNDDINMDIIIAGLNITPGHIKDRHISFIYIWSGVITFCRFVPQSYHILCSKETSQLIIQRHISTLTVATYYLDRLLLAFHKIYCFCKLVEDKKSLKIPKGQSESVYRRRTDNTMAK